MGLAKAYDKDFEYFFWSVYPKRVAKPQAEKEFMKLNFTDDQKRELREHIEKRKRRDKKWLPNKQGQTFIVDPERFLKHRRFEDEYESVSVYAAREKASEAEPEDMRPTWVQRGFSSEAAYRDAVQRKFEEAKAKRMGLH
jgi:hypothetical protein